MTEEKKNSILNSVNAPSMLIDLYRNRIRIHRNTLRLLDDPDFIQFLVHPEKNIIAVKKCKQDDFCSERIHWNTIHANQCCEFYSKQLITQIKNIGSEWTTKEKYLLLGKYYPKENLVLFSMSEST